MQPEPGKGLNMKDKKRKSLHDTTLGKLIEKYGFNFSNLALEMATFMLENKRNDKNYEYQLNRKRKQLYSELNRYAIRSSTPSVSRLLIMLRIIGCGMEELLLSLKIDEITKELLPTLNLDKNNLVHNDLNLLNKGYNFKLLETHVDYQFYIERGYLKATKFFKLISYQNDLSVIENLIGHNSKANPVSIICRNKGWEVSEGSVDGFANVVLNSALKRGEIVEITADLFYGQIDIQNVSFYTTQIIHPTDLLKISSTFSGLDEIIPIHFYQYSNGISYQKDTEPVMESILLNKNSSFKREFTEPSLNAIFSFDWSGHTKKIEHFA